MSRSGSEVEASKEVSQVSQDTQVLSSTDAMAEANLDNLLHGLPLRQNSPMCIIMMDASLLGWGRVLGEEEGGGSILMVQGRWKPVQTTWHINRLELMAVRLTLLHFHEQVSGHRILVRSNNSTTCYYINKFGGHSIPRTLLPNMEPDDVVLRERYRADNDPCSRCGQCLGRFPVSRQEINQKEWSLHGHVTNTIFNIWDRPNIDLFASLHNHKLPVYCSLLPCPAALSRNAF